MKSDAAIRWPDTGFILVEVHCFTFIAQSLRVSGNFDPLKMRPVVVSAASWRGGTTQWSHNHSLTSVSFQYSF